VPGVYELDVIAPPLTGAAATVRAELATLTFASSSDGLEIANGGLGTVTGRSGVALLGAGRDFDIAGRGAVAETLTVRVPDWAATLLVDVAIPHTDWNKLTGFAVTQFDSTGQQVAQHLLNYSAGRQRVTIQPELRRRPIAIELFPAFARAEGAHPWRATVRLRFLLAREAAAGGGKDVSVVPGGRVRVEMPALPALTFPEGFTPFVEARVRFQKAPNATAVRRVLMARR
jgi:hypothetical protein